MQLGVNLEEKIEQTDNARYARRERFSGVL